MSTPTRSHTRLIAALTLLVGLVTLSPLSAATLTLVPLDEDGEGFGDPTPVAPVAGNPGTTLGEQRLAVFEAALFVWGQSLASDVNILVAADFDDTLECDQQGGVLGFAGAFDAFRDFPGAPRPSTWFPSALADSLAGMELDEDLAPGIPAPDIIATFNSAVDNPFCLGAVDWFYGIGVPAPPGSIDLFSTVLHELAHGFGFATFVDEATGEKAPPTGLDDAYMIHLEDHSTGMSWPDMTNAQRRNSAVDTGDLHWVGPSATGGSSFFNAGVHPTGHLQMYAPDPLEQGSSVSHWDTELAPDELMEPFAVPGAEDIVTTRLLQDIGWGLLGCEPDADTLCLNNDRFRAEVVFTDFEGGSGAGMTRTIPGIGDSGLFYFFDEENLEFLIKVLDGCGINDHFWVFFAATTNVEFTLIVTDSVTGIRNTYFNPLGTSANTVNDTAAFPTCDAGTAVTTGAKAYLTQKRASEMKRVKAEETARLEARLAAIQGQGHDLLGDAFMNRLADLASPGTGTAPCVPSSTVLCLRENRFEVAVDFRDFSNNTGVGQTVTFPDIGDSGLFYFFSETNLELLVKALDGCGINGNFWLFFAATTDIEFTLTVRDTVTGQTKTYRNLLGIPADAVTDTTAFDTCAAV